jgi:hypothetical protein
MKRVLLFSPFLFPIPVLSRDPAKLIPSKKILLLRHFATSLFTILYGLKILSPYFFASLNSPPSWGRGRGWGHLTLGRGWGHLTLGRGWGHSRYVFP